MKSLLKQRGSASNSGGIGFLGLLAVLFIGLKLTGYIAWSWWWVTLPLWGGAVIGLLVLAGILYAAAKI